MRRIRPCESGMHRRRIRRCDFSSDTPSPGTPGEGWGEGSKEFDFTELAMRAPRDTSLRLRNFARELRQDQTDAEKRMWGILRSRRLSGFKFRRQYPLAEYIVDFFCVRERFAVELDGGQHSEPSATSYDEIRTRVLNDIGVRVTRYSDYDVLRTPDVVTEDIYMRLTNSLPSPRPSPGVPGEGEMPPSPLPSPGVPGEGERA